MNARERPPARVFTVFGTVLYVGPDGVLRHGDVETVASNAFLAAAPGFGPAGRSVRLTWRAGGVERPIDRRDDDLGVSTCAGETSAAPSLQLVPLERGLFGLKRGDNYLCAEPDGRVTASRSTCSTWECFIASEMWCGEVAGGSVPANGGGIDRRAVQQYLIDPRLRLRSQLKSSGPRILIYGYPKWSHGRVYYDVMTRLWRQGVVADILNWQSDHSAYFAELGRYYDLILTAPDGVRTLTDSYGVPPSKMIVVSHHENDIRMLIEQKGREIFDDFAAYGVVSYFVYCASMMQGVRRAPAVVSLGVGFDDFHAPIPSRLEVVGYASSMSVVTYDVEWKRGHLAEAAARNAGLEFKVAGSTGNQTSFHDMPDFYRTVDCVLTSSISEAAQLPVMEAAAAGRLVIGTPVGHFPLRAYQGGGIIAPIEADRFVAFVSDTLEHYRANPTAFRDKCQSIQAAAHQFDWSTCFPEWLDLIDRAQGPVAGRVS